MKSHHKVWIFVLMLLVLALSTHSQLTTTVFNSSLSQISLSFPQEFQTNYFFISVPNGTVSEARMRIQGFDLLGQAINPADIVLVTDVSGSMDDDCSSTRPPLNELNCKIRDAQRADISFLGNVNLNYMHVGLVDYSSCPNSNNVFHLTDNYADLRDEIRSYQTQSRTNMGGGMELAMHELLGANARPGIPKYMIIMTDGIANNYYTLGGYYAGGTCEQGQNPAKAYVRNIAQQAEDNGIIIYGIAFGSDADTALVQEITTNGQLYYAPNAATLTAIYNEIAQSISVQNFTTPRIRSTNPASISGWNYSTPYSGDVYWNGASCGAGASCSDFRNVIQTNLNQCSADPCDIGFSVYSTTVGMLNLSELYIEINEPPVSNYPPTGTCRQETFSCGQPGPIINLDNSANPLVTDPNDELNTLSWAYDRALNSTGGAYFTHNTNFNATRQFNVNLDLLHRGESFWKTYYFNVSDPWGEKTSACINVSYTGCLAPAQPVLNISDRTITFNITSQPGFHYNLRNMVDNNTNTRCTIDELHYRFVPPYDNNDLSNNFIIWGPDSQGNITIIPNNPEDWFSPTNDNVQVEAYCPEGGTMDGRTEIRRGKADVILVTDFSGSMKKAVDSWGQGTGILDCAQLYNYADARKSHLARCLDKDLTQVVMSYENNRIWPVFIHNDEIKAYAGDPTSIAEIINYIDAAGPQGDDKTCLACAANNGYDILSQYSSSERNKFIILMTDGVPTHCAQGSCTSISSIFGNLICKGFCDTNGQNSCGDIIEGCADSICVAAEGNTLYSANRAVDDLDVIFYTIAFGLVEDCTQAEYLLGTIASVSGGEYHHSSDVDELRRIYNEIAQKITQISENYTYPPVEYNISDIATLTIRYTAVSPTCGNGVRDNPNEECDDGNTNNNDKCSNICNLTYCSDSRIQQPNGRDNLWEYCDDGNLFSGDGCNSTCGSEWCGDHWLQPGLGEECDDGGHIPWDGCDANCQLETAPACGNTIIEVGEECDDGNNRNGDGCSATCQLERWPGCGNAIIEDGEQCDDGNTNPNDGCDWCVLTQSPPPYCGDGIIEEGEACDDGNNVGGDGCSDICRLEVAPGCGNGVEEQGEQCDDGCTQGNPLICDFPADSGDGCEWNCTLTPYPALSIMDTTISFDYSAYPGYKYTLDDMLSPYAILPVDESELSFTIPGLLTLKNFSITNPINPDGNISIVPTYIHNWSNATSERILVEVRAGTYYDSAYLTVIYTAVGAPQGRIDCDPNPQRYMLRTGSEISINLVDIFDFVGAATPQTVEQVTSSSPDVIVIFNPGDIFIKVRPNGLIGETTSSLRAITDTFQSDSCPIDFFNLGSNCDKEVCNACVSSGIFQCFVDNTCLDQLVFVLNPYTPVRIADLVSYTLPSGFRISSFAPLPPPEPEFKIEPQQSDNEYQIFNINGSLVSNGEKSAAIAGLSFTGYGDARICPLLLRLNYTIGTLSYDPITDLLITGSKAAMGYYELGGGVFSKGPYIFTAKVWLRE